jgi:hypothetical protein
MAELASVKRLGWSNYLGHTAGLVHFNLLGRNVKVQDFWVPAVEAMDTVLKAHGYEDPCDWTGSYLKRFIAGTVIWSWHSYGGAIDLDYGGQNPDSPDHPLVDNNPHLHRPIPWGDPGFGTEFQLLEHQVKAVLAIRTNNGKPVWRWLGTSIGDTMHFEPNCSPEDIATGIDPRTVTEEDDMLWADIVDDKTYAVAYELGYIKGDPALLPDYYYADGPAKESEKKNAYNIIQRNQMRAAKGLPITE